MSTPKQKRRPIGAGRIMALVLVALAALGLAYLKFAPSGKAVSVPAGAKAGQLSLHPCHYGTQQGSYAADCGTLVVRENRHDPRSRLIALPVTRIKALSAHPAEPVFRLQGGPGITNMTFPDASRFADKHDVVLVGYRGVDGSSKLDCPEVSSARERNDFLDPEGLPRGRGGLQGVRRASPGRAASTSPATRCPSAWTTSTRRAARSATGGSTCSARVPGRARR